MSKEEMDEIMKVVQSFEESGLLIKGVRETIESKAKERRFLGMFLRTLGASLLGNISAGKGVIRVRERTIRAGRDF